MGLGETVGYSNLLTQNNDIGATHYYSNNDSSWGIHISLLGDPTLHTSIVDPATSTSGTIVGNNIRLGWVSSIDSQILGYNIYRSSSRLGPYEKINGTLIASTSNEYSILATSTEYSYMIRSVKLENTSSGSFYNQSQGQFITVPTIPNTFPSISSISNMSFAIGSNTIASSSFTISDVESSTTDLIISTNSSNQSLASSTGISITSTSNENIKNISISLSENVIGSSTITIFAFDGMATSSRSFNIEVYRVQEQVVPVVVSGGGGGGGGGAYNNTYLASSTTTNTPVETDVNNINNNEKIEFNYNFGYGSAGNDILFLQRFLIKNKFLEEKKDTGYFGALTKKALIAFQEKYSDEILKPNGLDHGTGYMGPATRTKINSLNNLSKTTLPYIFKKPLKMYDSGQDVKKLQEFLNNNGFIVSEIGPGSIGNETENFLSKTYNALIKFQMKYYKDIKTSDEEPPGSLGISTINKINQILFAPKY
jgi:peptidoglycan hydrolase-like protein with peptidoglycan-binding domain